MQSLGIALIHLKFIAIPWDCIENLISRKNWNYTNKFIPNVYLANHIEIVFAQKFREINAISTKLHSTLFLRFFFSFLFFFFFFFEVRVNFPFFYTVDNILGPQDLRTLTLSRSCNEASRRQREIVTSLTLLDAANAEQLRLLKTWNEIIKKESKYLGFFRKVLEIKISRQNKILLHSLSTNSID